ncbi:MAG: hypothetical protein ABWX92_00660 [Mycetocola sp.]
MSEPTAPSGCALCGEIKHTHGMRFDSHGAHGWQPPTAEQRKARMQARRAAKTTTPTTSPEQDESTEAQA